jgi:hypothetical protein
LQTLILQGRRQVMGGAYRLVGRYLLDSGSYAGSLRAYRQALLAWPSYTLKHWRRILYAALSLVGLSDPLDRMRERDLMRQRARLVEQLKNLSPGLSGAAFGPDLAHWPGLCLQ